MFIVAVTGGIATGKSTVSKIFKKQGIPVVDADKIAREIVEPGTACWHKIREVFGEDVFYQNKQLNRAALGRAIFNDKSLRGKLNAITHPVIHRKIFVQIFKHFMSGHAWIVLDLPLLFETGILLDFIYKIITVTCEPEIQLNRLMTRNEFSAEDAQKRIESQMPLKNKCEKSHFVIDNSGTIEQTETEAMNIFQEIRLSKHHWRNRIIFLGFIFAVGFSLYYLNKIFNFLPSYRGIQY